MQSPNSSSTSRYSGSLADEAISAYYISCIFFILAAFESLNCFASSRLLSSDLSCTSFESVCLSLSFSLAVPLISVVTLIGFLESKVAPDVFRPYPTTIPPPVACVDGLIFCPPILGIGASLPMMGLGINGFLLQPIDSALLIISRTYSFESPLSIPYFFEAVVLIEVCVAPMTELA